MKPKLNYRYVLPSVSVSQTWLLLFRHIKMLETIILTTSGIFPTQYNDEATKNSYRK